MKKLLVVLLALACLSAAAFADGTTVGMGFGRTQFNIASSSGVSGENIQQGWISPGEAAFPLAQRFSLGFAWSNDHTAVNIDAYLGQPAVTLTWVNAYGTLKLMPDMFKVLIGKIAGDGFDDFRVDSAHPIHDINNGNVGRMSGWGAIAVLMPKDSGFEAAVFAKLNDPETMPLTGDLSNMITNYAFAASYTLPNLLKVTAGSTTDGYYPTPERNAFGRVALLLVPNLNLWADVKYTGFDVSPSVTNIDSVLAASYNMDPITIVFAGGYSVLDMSGANVSGWFARPEVYYNMGMLTLGLYVGVAGSNISGQGIDYEVEPYVKLNDFGLRVSFDYLGSTTSGAVSQWAIPVLIDWGF